MKGAQASVAFESGEFLEALSFITHLMGLRERELCEAEELELPCAAVDAPAPAGPCPPARSAPIVMDRETPNATNATTNDDLFIVTPILNVLRQFWRLADPASLLVGHAPAPGRAFEWRVLLQSVPLALRTGFLSRPAFLARLSESFTGSRATQNGRKMDRKLIRRKKP